MGREYLEFNLLGQWNLCKGEPFKAYHASSMRGELPQDIGQKGTLRNFGGGKQPKPSWSPKTAARPARLMESGINAHNPGVGD